MSIGSRLAVEYVGSLGHYGGIGVPYGLVVGTLKQPQFERGVHSSSGVRQLHCWAVSYFDRWFGFCKQRVWKELGIE